MIYARTLAFRWFTLFFILAALGLPWTEAAASDAESVQGKVLLDFDATWRCHDGNEDLGTAWREPDYDDSEWSQGQALLGYDTRNRRDQWPQPGLQTELTPNLLTYYFRTNFDYQGPTEGLAIAIDQIIDDGAVYYLNGVEVARSALMPAEGEIGFTSSARTHTNPWESHDTLEVDASHLRQGRNVLAVSVHNNVATSSDICLGARLTLIEPYQEPVGLLLTWQRNPLTTMTIDWQTQPDDPREIAAPVLHFKPVGDERWRQVRAQSFPFPYSDRMVHRVELTGLEPGTAYRFRVGGFKRAYYFNTMPRDLSEPLVFATGGDTRHRQSWMERTNRAAMAYDPQFVVWGGDLAYADGREDRVDRWYEWFDANMNTLIADDGRVVPIVVAIGNHEVQRGYYYNNDDFEPTNAWRERRAPYFYKLFAFPGHPGYGVLDFGNYMSLVIADSDHSNPIEGLQTRWMQQTLAQRQRVTHVFPVYHVPAYPSHRSYDGDVSQRVRENWVPLFERFGVRAAFENHDHTYKRTHPIRNGEVADDGVIYVGDGAWGVGTRSVHDVEQTWYLKHAEGTRHAIIVTLHGDRQHYVVVSENGDVIDEFEVP